MVAEIGTACLLSLLLPLAVFCQSSPARGDLELQVVDPSGAGVRASVELEKLETGQRWWLVTDEEGKRQVTGLMPGDYRVRVSRDGFAPFATTVSVLAGQTKALRIELQLGLASYSLDVVSTTPLAGLDRKLEEIPRPIQTATAASFPASGALDLSSLMYQRLQGVYWNELQGNPLQPDLNYRGYTASPLLGTPQGLAVYFEGVRLNQAFGDIVSWDLIPRMAISEVTLVPGSDPVFGLNALGGAISLRSKDGLRYPGTKLELLGGSFGRKLGEIEHGGSSAKGVNWFVAGNMFFEDGWRESSPSSARQWFSRLARAGERTTVSLMLSYANNGLIGNGLQEQRFLERDYRSVYTKPDLTANRSPLGALHLRRSLGSRLHVQANGYFRLVRTATLNGDINEESLDQSLYQPNARERSALAAAGFSGFPLAGESAANTPFPKWRCLANVLLRDEPSEKCNGLLNRSLANQRNFGVSAQASWQGGSGRRRHQWTAGGSWDGNQVHFAQSTELGYLNPDRSVTGLAAFADGVTGGFADGEPYDRRVDLRSKIASSSLFATDTLSWGHTLHITLSGRFHQTSIRNVDQLRPAPGTGSLTGTHAFHRFNPALGGTWRLRPSWTLYGSYAESNRAPTAIELGCADPEVPCRLPNAMAGDPPLDQVVTRTLEAGLRSLNEGALRWAAGWFRSANRNDILFVASEQTGFGYFKNFGQTVRQGAEFDFSARLRRVVAGAGYTFLEATFESPEVVQGTANSTNDRAQTGGPGLEGTIEIEPGDRIPLTPRHVAKTFVDWQLSARVSGSFHFLAVSSSFARGNENNRHQPDGRYFLGRGSSPGYALANLGCRYELSTRLQLFLQINNLFNRRYYTAAQLGPTGFTADGRFVARPFPPIGNEYPVQQATFYAPGAPRGIWAGLRWRF
ncbi:MAG: TonB-dependent receptor [Bryobacteraceae bacterium]|nr:TonB-dependent receptor [Bryobacteraceae bacterium]MDW8377621.1 TonB-dependent receptor [Bryobacterales bacterium]